MGNVLIIGSSGQLGSVLVETLGKRYGDEHIIASDIKVNPAYDGIFEQADATNHGQLKSLVEKYQVDQIYHLAAILSANGEKDPMRTWEVNMKSFFNVMEIAQNHPGIRVFFPSSIAVFGPDINRVNTPQNASLLPTTAYGISKVAGENWASYFHKRYKVDVRSIRYPGIVGYQSSPGGGTTDYAVDIFHHAVQGQPYECFLNSDTRLPMIYMDDAIRATIELMEAPPESISVRTGYNIAGSSFTPEELVKEIKKSYEGFQITYKPDFRQEIADTWPESIDDSVARNDWGWKPTYDTESLSKTMLTHLREYYLEKEGQET